MAKILFVVPPFWGHINPTLTLGSELYNKGHQVAWASMLSLDHLIPQATKCYFLDSDKDNNFKNYFKSVEEYGQKMFGLQSLQYLYEELLIPMSRFMVSNLPKVFNHFSPDIIITDNQAFGASITSIKFNISFATLITAPTVLKNSIGMQQFNIWENQQIENLKREFQILKSDSIVKSKLLSIAFTSTEFLDINQSNDTIKFVGPLIKERYSHIEFDWDHLSKSPLPKVLVSLGTVFSGDSKINFYKKVIQAFENRPYTVIVVADPNLFSVWPDNFIVQKRVPQINLLSHIDAVICHSGHNTVCESIYYGLPLIVIPIAYDQFQTSQLVTNAGCGIRLKFKRLKPAHLIDALDLILTSPVYKASSKAISQTFYKAGGIDAAIHEIEMLIEKTVKV